MSRAALLARARRAAEALMVDTCTVRHRTGETTNDNTGVVTPTWATVYTGKCKIQQSSMGGPSASPESPGGDYQRLVILEVHLPIAAPEAQVGDEVTITAAAFDPALVDQVFVVQELAGKSLASARRLGVTRRTS